MGRYINDSKVHEIADKYNVLSSRIATHHLDISVEDYLRYSDYLISDISGIAIDFMILGKQVIFIEPDNELYKDGKLPMNWDIKREYRAGYIVRTKRELFSRIEDCILKRYICFKETKCY